MASQRMWSTNNMFLTILYLERILSTDAFFLYKFANILFVFLTLFDKNHKNNNFFI